MKKEELIEKIKSHGFLKTDDIDELKPVYKIEKSEDIFVAKMKPVLHNLGVSKAYDFGYFIFNQNGERVGEFPVYLRANTHSALEVNYGICEAYRKKGIASAVLEDVIKDAFVSKRFDGFSTSQKDASKTSKISYISLEIAEENQPSRKLAAKFGFIELFKNGFVLDKQKWLESRSPDLANQKQ